MSAKKSSINFPFQPTRERKIKPVFKCVACNKIFKDPRKLREHQRTCVKNERLFDNMQTAINDIYNSMSKIKKRGRRKKVAGK